MKMLINAIEAEINNYLALFIEKISEKYGIDKEEINSVWEETMGEKIKSKKVKKAKKEGVKKGMTGYQVFAAEQRPELNEEFKHLSGKARFGEVSSAIGKLWKGMTDEEKAEYNTKAIEYNLEEKPKGCCFILSSGKRKGEECGIKTKIGSEYCQRHSTKVENPAKVENLNKKVEVPAKGKDKEIAKEVVEKEKEAISDKEEEDKISSEEEIEEEEDEEIEEEGICNVILSSGKRKGFKCGLKVKNGNMCARHSKKGENSTKKKNLGQTTQLEDIQNSD